MMKKLLFLLVLLVLVSGCASAQLGYYTTKTSHIFEWKPLQVGASLQGNYTNYYLQDTLMWELGALRYGMYLGLQRNNYVMTFDSVGRRWYGVDVNSLLSISLDSLVPKTYGVYGVGNLSGGGLLTQSRNIELKDDIELSQVRVDTLRGRQYIGGDIQNGPSNLIIYTDNSDIEISAGNDVKVINLTGPGLVNVDAFHVLGVETPHQGYYLSDTLRYYSKAQTDSIKATLTVRIDSLRVQIDSLRGARTTFEHVYSFYNSSVDSGYVFTIPLTGGTIDSIVVDSETSITATTMVKKKVASTYTDLFSGGNYTVTTTPTKVTLTGASNLAAGTRIYASLRSITGTNREINYTIYWHKP